MDAFWSHYFTIPLLSPFIDDMTLSSFACVRRQFHQEVKGSLLVRKRACVQRMMRFFHRPNTSIFSFHRFFQEGYEMNLKRLFFMMPEWFAYMEEHQITYLYMDCPAYSAVSLRTFDVPHIMEGIMGFLERNRTLFYCNLGLFYAHLSRDRLLSIMLANPYLYHLEMTSVPFDLIPTSLYRHENGRVEWRRYPPPLAN